MPKNNREKKVIFRRINGRIVPISIAASSIAGGVVLNKKGVEVSRNINAWGQKKYRKKIKQFTSYKEQDTKLKALRNIYKNDLIKAGIHPSDVYLQPTTTSAFIMDRDYFNPSIKIRKIQLERANTETLLHELGHAQQWQKGGNKTISAKYRDKFGKDIFNFTGLKKIRKFRRSVKETYRIDDFATNPIRHKLRNLYIKTVDKSVDKILNIHSGIIQFKADSSLLLNEMSAWKRAFKIAKGKKQKARILKYSIAPMATYIKPSIIRATGKAAIISGLAIGGYSLIRGKK